MKGKDLYGILGVSKTASAPDIKKAYRKLAQKYHPDRNPDDSAAEERFKEVSAAFAVLGDEKKRALYDEFGPDGLREGFDANAARNYQRWAGGAGGMGGGPGGFDFDLGGLGGFGDLEELLGGLFGGRSPRARRPSRGANVEGEVILSVHQAVEGTEVTVEGRRVRVPAGAAEGQRIRVRGQGGHGPAGRGDLLLTVKIATPGFLREGSDLVLEVPLKVSEAVLGTKVEVPTPEGTTLTLTIPPGTQSGQRLRVRGRGVPTKGGGRGNLYVQATVRLPTGDAEGLEEAARALDAFY